MELEHISARIAPRNAWQAMDLGVHAWRSWWRPLTLIWLATTLLPFCLILWLSYPDNLLLGMLAFWWLKPLWDKPLLAYCARALFEPDIHPWRAVMENRAALLRDLPALLLWRRLDPSRSFHLPVSQLEGQTGASYSRRVRALGMGGHSHGGTLTIGLLHVEQGFAYGLTVLLMMLWPAQVALSEVEWFLDTSSPWFLVSFGCWYLAMSITEPLYVASGFTAYLNRRTWLEAWDLQLGLRRIGQRRQLGAAAVMLMIGLAGALGWTEPATAEPTPRQQAVEILASEDFSPMEIREGWRLRDLDKDAPEQEEEETPWWVRLLTWLFSGDAQDDPGAWPDWLRHLDSPAELLRLLLWSVAISLVIWLLWRFRHQLVQLASAGPAAAARPVTLAGLDIRRESLPPDIAASALAALADGDLRLALALLYRGTLSRLMDRHQVALPPGSTESECLEAFRQTAPTDQGVALLARLTPLWMATAWAHRPPAAEAVDELARHWQHTFDGAVP